MPRIAASLALALAASTAAAAWAAEPGPARQAELLHLLKQDCGSCHGLTMRGGLGPALVPERLAERTDETLVEAIVDGRPGTAMPPWRFEVTPEEAAWLVRTLREGLP